MNEWMWHFLDRVRLDAAHLTLGDLSFVEDSLMGKSAVSVDDWLKRKNWVSSNLEMRQKGSKQPWQRYIFLEQKMAGHRKPWKVAVLGLSALQGFYNRTLFEAHDPAEALPGLLTPIRGRFDYVILLTDLHAGQVEELIRGNAGINLAILANHGVSLNPPKRVGDTAVVEANDQGKFLGELALYLDRDAQVSRIRNRYIELNASIPDPPELGKMAQEAEQQLNAIRLKASIH